jgi:hypothetical protein
MLFDVSRRYPRAYVHRHKVHIRPDGFTAEGKFEIKYLIDQVEKLVVGNASDEDLTFTVPPPSGFGEPTTYTRRRIYSCPPHITCDNHFSGDNVLDYAGGKGFGITQTCRRDRFPEGLKPFLHHEMVAPGCLRSKAMRYEKPIVAIKQVAAKMVENNAAASHKAYTKTLVSFQSTGATNICGVNNLPSADLYVTVKARGKGPNKRLWGIEQNEARQTYLGHYYGVDNVDHMVKNAKVRYTTFKYWHAPFLHALSIAVIAAYDMYIECCEGGLDSEWFVEEKERLSFRDFRMRLSESMIEYDPRKQMYRGDEAFRKVTKLGRRKREDSQKKSYWKGERGGVSVENFKIAKTSTRYSPSRLCGPLDDLEKHMQSIVRRTHTGPCAMCGRATAWKCGLCDRFLCLGKAAGGCHIALHNDLMFGMARCDFSELHGGTLSNWKAPSEAAKRRNSQWIMKLRRIWLKEGGQVG